MNYCARIKHWSSVSAFLDVRVAILGGCRYWFNVRREPIVCGTAIYSNRLLASFLSPRSVIQRFLDDVPCLNRTRGWLLSDILSVLTIVTSVM